MPSSWPRSSGWARASTRSCRPASSTISGVLPSDKAIESLKKAIKKTYGKKGDEIVQMNFKAVDGAVGALQEVKVPDAAGRQADDAADGAGRRAGVRARTSPRRSCGRRATRCRSAPCRTTAPGRPARPSTRSAISPWRFPSGTRSSASSAASARWSARMRPSASRSTTRTRSTGAPADVQVASTPRARTSPA